MQCERAGGEPAVGGVRANRRQPKEQQSSQWRRSKIDRRWRNLGDYGLEYDQTKDSMADPSICIMYRAESACVGQALVPTAEGGSIKGHRAARDGRRIKMICNEPAPWKVEGCGQ